MHYLFIYLLFLKYYIFHINKIMIFSKIITVIVDAWIHPNRLTLMKGSSPFITSFLSIIFYLRSEEVHWHMCQLLFKKIIIIDKVTIQCSSLILKLCSMYGTCWTILFIQFFCPNVCAFFKCHSQLPLIIYWL